MKKSKPDFIVVGAMKAGSSTLSFHLGNHKNIAIPQKEVHFFNNELNYKRGVDWYLNTLLAVSNDSTLLIGEKTPTYSYLDTVPKKIHDAFPDVKLIWVLRNPIKRAYSNYWHAYKSGFDLLSFEEAVKRESERVKESIYYGYLERSKYFDQIKRYLEFFSKEQMYFLLFEDLVQNPTEELNKIFNFLGIDEDGFELKDEVRNPTFIPRWNYPLHLARKLMSPHNTFFKVLKRVSIIGVKPGYPPLSKNLKKDLETYFHPFNLELASFLGRDLSVWNK